MKKFLTILTIFVIVLTLTACGPSKAEQAKWNETKKTVVYTTDIVDFTYNTVDSAKDRTDFYVWWENSLGVETSFLIDAEDFVLYAHAFHEGLQVKVESEVGIGKNGVVEVTKTVSIVEQKN